MFLLEAKWQRQRVTAGTLYQFKGKVDGKLSGTLGIFISMSGYTRDGIEALTIGKDLNVILLDGLDIDVCMQGTVSFQELLLDKLRLAAEEGVIYTGFRTKLATVGKMRDTLIWQEE